MFKLTFKGTRIQPHTINYSIAKLICKQLLREIDTFFTKTPGFFRFYRNFSSEFDLGR